MPSFWNNAMHSRIKVYGSRKIQTRGSFGGTRTVTQPGASVEVGSVLLVGGLIATGIIGAELVVHGAKSAYHGLASLIGSKSTNSVEESTTNDTPVEESTTPVEDESVLVNFAALSGMTVDHLRDCGVTDEEGVCIAAVPFYELDHTPRTLVEVTNIARLAGKLQ